MIGEWVEHALCSQVDDELFFPEKGRSSAPARSICAQCPVVKPCLDYALNHHVVGVWGGTSEHQRTLIRRQLGITLFTNWIEHGTDAGARAHYRRNERPCQRCLDAANHASRERTRSNTPGGY